MAPVPASWQVCIFEVRGIATKRQNERGGGVSRGFRSFRIHHDQERVFEVREQRDERVVVLTSGQMFREELDRVGIDPEVGARIERGTQGAGDTKREHGGIVQPNPTNPLLKLGR